MPSLLRSSIRFLGLFVVFFMAALQSYGTHIFGVDLYYTSIGANTYTVNLVVYGDCYGSAFYTLASAAPEIDIYNGNTLVNSVSLSIQPPNNGIEVTPVCPSQAGNTTCTNISNPLPGIKKFVYSGNVILSGTSPVWRFVFAGNMGGTSTAGRSSSITNISSPSTSTIQLVDTLNNTLGANSNAIYSTIPTPFFCISSPANYNPGAIDPDGDALSFSLVPAIDASSGSSVNYIAPFTATAPIGASAGTFSFSNVTGQLSFTPNILQKALVVFNVRELTPGGVLKGTSQREMTVVVLSPCTNNPPTGVLSAASSGTLVSSTQLNVCTSAGPFNFQINPTDADGDSITVTATGLPAGASFNVVGNGNPAPHGTFQWNTSSVAPGNYTFYVTYLDHGCPLSSSQTIAYTISVMPVPTETVNIISGATCTSKAIFHISPGGTPSPWVIDVLQGATTVHAFSSVTGIITDSLPPGTYTIRIYSAALCYKDTTITIAAPPLPSATITATAPLCINGTTGDITVTGTAGATPFQYAIGGGAYTPSGSFGGLSPIVYTVHVKDAAGCVKDTIIGVPNAPATLAHLAVTKPFCAGVNNGNVIVSAYNSVAPYTFAIGSGAFASSDTFSGLGAGAYTFHIMNANGCIADTAITLIDSQYLHGALVIPGILCNGGVTPVTVNAIGGFGGPYLYACNSGIFSAINNFNLLAGSDTFHITDPQSCSFDTIITVTQPSPISIHTDQQNVSCYGLSNGLVNVAASGGTPGYLSEIDGGAFQSALSFTGLVAGNHIVGVKDTNGCVYFDTITITQPPRLSYDSIIMQQPVCNGNANGSIHIYSSGGVPAYTYAIDAVPFSVGSLFSGLLANTHTLHIKDANGCTLDSVVNLQQPLPLVPVATVTPSLCQTLANGQVVLSATGGTPGYTFASGAGVFAPSGTFSPLAAGVYTFHIKDAHGCNADTTLAVVNSVHISGLFTITPDLCHGDANGAIALSGNNGTAPYTYALGGSAYSAANTFPGLAAGSWVIHIQDANGCIADTSVTVNQPPALFPVLAVTPPSCYAYANGSTLLNATGGSTPYTYSLNGGAFSLLAFFGGLTAGTDTITVKDAHGCMHDTAFIISQPVPLVINSITGTNISCNGGGDGAVTIVASGGTPGYQYAANSGSFQSGNILTGLSSGHQVLHVHDAQGCTADSAITLSQPAPFHILGVAVLNPTCEGFANGAVALFGGGGTPGYQYSSDNINFHSNMVFSGLTEGTYNFYLTDTNHCTADTSITLIGLPHILFDSIKLTRPSCTGNNDGAATIFASGGVQPLSYSLSGNYLQTAPTVFTHMSYGQYTVTIKDSMNCVKDSTFTLPQPDTFSVTAQVTPNDCIGPDNGGAITTSIKGGTPPYYYLWTVDSSNAPYITGRPNGVYTVWVRDSHNCFDTVSAEILYNDCCTPFIPNAFSPNGDGKNDVFRIKYKGDIRIIEFSIFNRFGERIFLSEYSEHGWDGTYKGEPCDIGTYYYYIRLLCGNLHDNIQEFTGDVTLVK